MSFSKTSLCFFVLLLVGLVSCRDNQRKESREKVRNSNFISSTGEKERSQHKEIKQEKEMTTLITPSKTEDEEVDETYTEDEEVDETYTEDEEVDETYTEDEEVDEEKIGGRCIECGKATDHSSEEFCDGCTLSLNPEDSVFLD